MLEYGADKSIAVNHQPIALAELQTRLRDIFETRKEKTMFIVGDPSLRYGEIVAVIDAAKGAGVEKVGIVTLGMRAGSHRSGASQGRQLEPRNTRIPRTDLQAAPSRERPFVLYAGLGATGDSGVVGWRSSRRRSLRRG